MDAAPPRIPTLILPQGTPPPSTPPPNTPPTRPPARAPTCAPSRPTTATAALPPLCHVTQTSRQRPPIAPTRPPPHKQTSSTEGGLTPMDGDLIAIALLSAEARRRGGIMMRERGFLGVRRGHAHALLHSRVRLLEKDVRAIVRTIEKTRARVSAAGYCRPCFPEPTVKPARVGR